MITVSKHLIKDDNNTEDKDDELKLIITPLVPSVTRLVASKNIASSTRQNNIHTGLTGLNLVLVQNFSNWFNFYFLLLCICCRLICSLGQCGPTKDKFEPQHIQFFLSNLKCHL